MRAEVWLILVVGESGEVITRLCRTVAGVPEWGPYVIEPSWREVFEHLGDVFLNPKAVRIDHVIVTRGKAVAA